MIVIVTGGRGFRLRKTVYAVLDRLGEFELLIDGGCATGADMIARDWAQCRSGIRNLTMSADWVAHGKSAGPLRNAAMLAAYPDAIVVAFPGGKGTADCVRKAKARGMRVIRVDRNGVE